MNLNNIGSYIKNLRTNANMSQDELASMLFVSRQAISNWERAKTIPDIENIKKLSEIFNVSVENILVGENDTSMVLYENALLLKKKSKKLLLLSLLCCLLFSSIFLVYYFIVSYNKTRVYTIFSDGAIKDGLFVTTNESWFLDIGPIETENDDCIAMELYLKINGQKELLSGYYPGIKNGITIKENIGYNEIFRFSEKETINNMYLDITYKDNKVVTKKIDFTLEYDNKKILFQKDISITDPGNKKKIDVSDSNKKIIELLKERGIKSKRIDKYSYDYKFNDNDYNVFFLEKINFIRVKNDDEEISMYLNQDDSSIFYEYDGIYCIVDRAGRKTTTKNIAECRKKECNNEACEECEPVKYCNKETKAKAFEIYDSFIQSLY